jgi:RES domain-containing protein
MNDSSVDIYKTRLTKLSTESKPFDSVVYRSSTPQYATETDLLTGEGSCKNGGRWNPKGTAAVYAALTLETAMAETLATNRYFGIPLQDAMPRTFVAFLARLQHVLDFRQGDLRRRLQVSLDRILHVDWRKENKAGQLSITQIIGQAAYEAGLEGILVPSAQNPKDANLVIFPANLKTGSELILFNKEKL